MLTVYPQRLELPSDLPCLYLCFHAVEKIAKIGRTKNLFRRYESGYKLRRLHCVAYAGPFDDLEQRERALLLYFRERFPQRKRKALCEWFRAEEAEAFQAFCNFVAIA